MGNGVTPEELKDRMNPDHLTVEDQRDKVQEQTEAAKPKKEPEGDPEDNPRSQREYTFDFDWVDGNGKRWHGKFTNEVPDIQTRQYIGNLRSQLGNNIPFESLDPITREMNLVIAHLSFTLKKRPKWADNLGALFNFELIQRIYQEVAEHEATFLGYGETAPAG